MFFLKLLKQSAFIDKLWVWNKIISNSRMQITLLSLFRCCYAVVIMQILNWTNIGVREGGAGGAAAPPIFWEFIYSGKNCLVIRATTVWWLNEYISIKRNRSIISTSYSYRFNHACTVNLKWQRLCIFIYYYHRSHSWIQACCVRLTFIKGQVL
jgi:hypothetical protein